MDRPDWGKVMNVEVVWDQSPFLATPFLGKVVGLLGSSSLPTGLKEVANN